MNHAMGPTAPTIPHFATDRFVVRIVHIDSNHGELGIWPHEPSIQIQLIHHLVLDWDNGLNQFPTIGDIPHLVFLVKSILNVLASLYPRARIHNEHCLSI